MARDRTPWHDGRKAWERLNGWHQDSPRATPGHPDDGGAALTALSDLGLVRRLLDQAELVAVKTARSHGKSWAEVATKLGVTRQSAWEKWRDLDDDPAHAAAAVESLVATGSDAAVKSVAEVAAWELRMLHERATVMVPNVVGMSWDDAHRVLQRARLLAAGADPDGPPLATLGWPNGVVVDQKPVAGTSLPPGSPVTLWLSGGGDGGSAGVREPRRPTPPTRSATAMRDEEVGDAVG